MSGFLLGLVVGILINLATALFSREKALKLIPWMLMYVFIHASFVVLESAAITQLLVNSMKELSRWTSYALVMIVGAVLAAIYWRVALGVGETLDRVTTTSSTGVASATEQEPTRPISSPSADEIADAIRTKSEPAAAEKARRYRLRKDLTQYLVVGGMEKDTFRILLQPTVDERGARVDPTEKLGKAMLRIQEWHTELTFYVHSRLGEDYALWLMTKTHSEPYPSNIGNVPGLSRSWDTVASGVAKVEQLLREFPDIPGGAEAATARESQWIPAREIVEWHVEPSSASTLKVSFHAKKELENPILRLQFDTPLAGQPRIDWEEHPIIIGNKRLPSPDVYQFEVLGKWPTSRRFTGTFLSKQPLTLTEVSIRFW